MYFNSHCGRVTMSPTITAKNPFYEFPNKMILLHFLLDTRGLKEKEIKKRGKETAMCSFHNEQNIKK